MNHIRIQKVMTPYGYEEDYWCIDEKILPDYLDEDTAWQRFGKIISSEFKCYINQEVLTTNLT